MSSLKERRFPCDLCIILLFGIGLISAQEPTQDPGDSESSTRCLKGFCWCGGFPTKEPLASDEPLLSQNALVVKCAPESRDTCKELCLALATATRAKGPEVLCARLKNAKDLLLSVFYKICDDPWTYGHMTMDVPLCCDDGEHKECVKNGPPNHTD